MGVLSASNQRSRSQLSIKFKYINSNIIEMTATRLTILGFFDSQLHNTWLYYISGHVQPVVSELLGYNLSQMSIFRHRLLKQHYPQHLPPTNLSHRLIDVNSFADIKCMTSRIVGQGHINISTTKTLIPLKNKTIVRKLYMTSQTSSCVHLLKM